MAISDRMRQGFRNSSEIDEYLHNEYRAEEGAYMEHRPAYERYDAGDRDSRVWGPRIPTDYYLDEGYTRMGTAAPLGEPLQGPDVRDERLSPSRSYDRSARHHDAPRYAHPRDAYSRDKRSHKDPRQQDRVAGRKLLHAAEHFYEDLAGAVGLEPDRDHRGRGPRNYRRSDERILDEVSHRLTDDGYVDASDIEVTVKNQEVTLSGTVNTRFEKRHAEDIVEAVAGVAHVQNNLRIAPRSGER